MSNQYHKHHNRKRSFFRVLKKNFLLGSLGLGALFSFQCESTDPGSIQIEAGNSHSCAVVNGGAWCWGANGLGRLGDGTTTNRNVPVQVSGLESRVTQISAGFAHSCAVVNGGAWCWGSNFNGNLGDGSTTDRNVPVQVSGLESGVTQISAGGDLSHSCAVVNGGAMCWGANNYGQLGDGSMTQRLTPVQVSGLESGVTQISVGGEISNTHTCAVVNGGAWCWGANAVGQLGDGSTTQRLTPVQVSGLESGVTQIEAGFGHSCAVVNGGAWCWGANGVGQLGDGTTTNSRVPVRVVDTLFSNAECEHDDVFLCSLLEPRGVTQVLVSINPSSSCAVVNGGAWCWGTNVAGQLGDGSTTNRNVPVRVLSSGIGSPPIRVVTQIAVGGAEHNCAVVNGAPWCWGTNAVGQLGDGTTTNSRVPVRVSRLSIE